jgi:hypothetical protein
MLTVAIVLVAQLVKATVEWWANQSQAAQEAAFDPTDRISIEEAIQQLYKFCWGANVYGVTVPGSTLLFLNIFSAK